MSPLGILHIAAFVTLCEAYMGIEPHFNLWNYFFCVQLRPYSDMEAMVWGYIDIYVHTEPGIDPYFRLSVSNPLVGWRIEWFSQRNNTGMLLFVVTGRVPTAQPSSGYGMGKKDSRQLQLM
jgi:hypothetical protein